MSHHLRTSIFCALLACSIPCLAAETPSENKKATKETTEDVASTLTSTTKPILVDAASPAFTIRLSANAGTGYQWFLRDYNTRLVRLLGQQYVAAKTKLIGAPGVSAWDFQLQQIAFVAPQVTTITLEYRRAWEQKVVKKQTFTIISGGTSNALLKAAESASKSAESSKTP